MKRNRALSNSLRWWIGSYSAIIIIAIVINLFGHAMGVLTVEQEMERTNALVLNNIKSIYDMYFQSVQDAAYRTLRSSSVAQLNSRRDLRSDRRTELVLEVSKDLNLLLKDSVIVENAFVVIKSRDMCIDSLNLCTISMAYDIYFKDVYPSREQWETEMFETSAVKWVFAKDGSDQQAMYLVHPLPQATGLPSCLVILEFRMSAVNKMMQESLENDESKFYMVHDGEVILGSDSDLQLTDPEKDGRVSIGGESYIISRVESQIQQLQYVYCVSNDVQRKKINLVISVVVLCYLACILIGGLCVWFFTKRNYENTKAVQAEIRDRNEKLSANILSQILQRKIKVENGNQSFLAKYNLRLSGKEFVIASLDFSLYAENEEEAGAERYQVVFTYAREKIVSMTEEIGNVNFCDINDVFICVFSCFETTRLIRQLQEILTQLRGCMLKEKQVDFICALSRVTDDISGLADLYEQTVEMIGFRFMQQDKFIFEYGDIMQDKKNYEYSMETERRLLNLIYAREKAKAAYLLEEVLEDNIRKISMSMLRILISVLINTLLKAASELDVDEQLDYSALSSVAMQVTNDASYKHAKKAMVDFIDQLCQLHMRDTKGVQDIRMQKILEFIEKNYARQDLSVGMIAEEFGITPNYMSRYFKEQMGEGMLDYIVKLRLSKAKGLLKDSGKTVGMISQEVGFTKTMVLTKAFKRYEGITPTQYRELQKEARGAE